MHGVEPGVGHFWPEHTDARPERLGHHGQGREPPAVAGAGFHVLVKPAGDACNLDCSYCFYKKKHALYPNSRRQMSPKVLDRYLRQLVETGSRRVTLSWQGGEPTLMGRGFFREAMARVEQLRRPGQRIEHTLQTNGMLLDDEWCALLKAHDVLVGISIDGPRPLHDAGRPDHRGRGSFDRVMRGLDRLRAHGVRYNVLTAVNAANAGHPLEVYRFLRDEAGADYIQFIPVVIRGQGAATGQDEAIDPRSVRGAAYGRFLCCVFDEWVRHDVGRVGVQTFEICLEVWSGTPPSVCVNAPVCGTALALEHNGDLYACDHFVRPEYRRGNILEADLAALASGEAQRRFGLDKLSGLPKHCRACDVLPFCWGGCPKDRFGGSGEEPGVNVLCDGYRMMFRHVAAPMRIMAWLLRRHRPLADIVQWLDRLPDWVGAANAIAGRNDACACGSGRRLKHCCGAMPCAERGPPGFPAAASTADLAPPAG